jgi:hypothetical protein
MGHVQVCSDLCQGTAIDERPKQDLLVYGAERLYLNLYQALAFGQFLFLDRITSVELGRVERALGPAHPGPQEIIDEIAGNALDKRSQLVDFTKLTLPQSLDGFQENLLRQVSG